MRPIRVISLLLLLFIAALPASAGEPTLYGAPQGAGGTLVEREIYILCADPETRFADWAAYVVSPRTIYGDTDTHRYWKADPALPETATLEPEDYRGAHAALHTDRGHMVPLAGVKGTPHWEQTNYLSNITPQKSALNQGPWRLLEEEIRNLARNGYRVYVVTGTLYERPMPPLPGADEPHRLPSGYYKAALVEERPGDPATLRGWAWIMDQQTPRDAVYGDHAVPIDEVERRAGVDLLAELEEGIQEAFEARAPGSLKAYIAAGEPAPVWWNPAADEDLFLLLHAFPGEQLERSAPRDRKGITVYVTESGTKYHRKGCQLLAKTSANIDRCCHPWSTAD
ncbi:MAG: DNA/RNA non-specific endonuclease [Synergistales bacterium]|nr:DNA/RNA non-specific endonuclease [Synergistales bacterium]